MSKDDVTLPPLEKIETPAAPAEKAPVTPERRETITKALEKREQEVAAAGAVVPALSERARDPKTGQFVEPPKGGAVAKTSPTGLEPTVRKPMPKAWKQEYAPHWEKLDPTLNEMIAGIEDKREKDFLAGIEQYKAGAAQAHQFKQLLGPYEGAFTAQYGSTERGIDTLLKISDYANRDPMGFINWFAQQRGLQLGGQPTGEQQQPDPIQQALQAALQPWAQRVAGLENQLQSFSQQRSQASEQQMLAQVNGFLDGKDEKGVVKHPLADERTDDFVAHIQVVRTRNPDWDDQRVLETAYENLAWTVPEMRSTRLEKEAADKREREAAEVIRQKAAAVQVKGAPTASPPSKANPKDRRAVIEQAFDGLSR